MPRRWSLAQAQTLLAVCALMDGDLARAEALGRAGLADARAVGDRFPTALALYFLGRIALARHDAETAAERFSASLAVSQELGDKAGMIRAQNGLGMVALQQGAAARAADHHCEALRLLRELREPLMVVDALEGLACAASLAGQPEQTAQLLGAVEAMRRRIGSTRTVHDKARLELAEAAARAALPESVFTAAWAAGQTLSLEQALTSAWEQPASAGQPSE